MASVINSTVGQSTDTNAVTTPAIDTTGADLIVLIIFGFDVGGFTLTDSVGNTYVSDGGTRDFAGRDVQFHRCYSPTTNASHTFSLPSPGATGSHPTLVAIAITGSAATAYDTQSAVSSGVDVTSLASANCTPSQDNDAIICVTYVETFSCNPVSLSDGTFTKLADAGTSSNAIGVGVWIKFLGSSTSGVAVAPTVTYSGTNHVALVQTAAFKMTGGGAVASPFNGAVFENPNPKRVVKDKSFSSPFPINLYGKDTFFGAPGQAPEYTLDKPTKLRSNSRLNYEINTNLGLYFPVTPFIIYEDTRPRRRKTNTLNFESNLDLDLITVSVVPFVAYDVDRKFLRRNRNLDWISNTDINLFSVANPFLVTEVTIPRRLLRQFRDFNSPINLNLLGKDTFFGAPGQAPLFDLKNPNTHRSNARLSFEVPITLFNRIPPTPVDDTTALLLFANLHIRLDVKREMDSGNVDALASDVGGTPVTFNKAFLDVDSITLTVAATQPITAIYDFVDVPNPTGFTVYAYDSSGNRVNFTVSWKARGIV